MQFLSTSIVSLAFLFSCSTLSVDATPLRAFQHNDEVDMVARSMLGQNANAVSWDSMPLERSPLDPEDELDQLQHMEARELIERVVYNPPITYPTTGTVWTAGKVVQVKWTVNQDDIPANAKNYRASLKLGYLVRGGDGNEHLQWDLGGSFPITDESVKFRLPANLTTRDDYIVVLFGDSGNRSKRFTINGKPADAPAPAPAPAQQQQAAAPAPAPASASETSPRSDAEQETSPPNGTGQPERGPTTDILTSAAGSLLGRDISS